MSNPTPNTKQELRKKIKAKDLDAYMLKMGFHRHKQSHRGKGLYYSVGGYDVAKSDAENMYRYTKQLLIDNAKAEVNRALDKVKESLHNYAPHRTKEAIEQVRKEINDAR